jgi:hypothetical protein
MFNARTVYMMSKLRRCAATLAPFGSIGLLGWLLALPCAATVIPPLSFSIPGLGAGPGKDGIVASQVITSGSAQILYLDHPGSPGLTAQVDSFPEPTTLREFSGDIVSTEKKAVVSANGTSASAESTGSAQPGTLRAKAVARIGRPDLSSTASAITSTSVAFVDVLKVGDNGNPTSVDDRVDYNISLAVGGSLGFSSQFASGSASARAQVWLFPFGDFGVLPPPGSSINGQYYESASALLNQGGSETNANLTLGTFDRLEPDSFYWIFGILEVNASVEYNNLPLLETTASARADYSSTVHLFIDPSPTNPGASYTTASGLSYLTPVPEPSSAILVTLGMATLGVNFRARKGQRQQ